jgi:hypothetical protein
MCFVQPFRTGRAGMVLSCTRITTASHPDHFQLLCGIIPAWQVGAGYCRSSGVDVQTQKRRNIHNSWIIVPLLRLYTRSCCVTKRVGICGYAKVYQSRVAIAPTVPAAFNCAVGYSVARRQAGHGVWSSSASHWTSSAWGCSTTTLSVTTESRHQGRLPLPARGCAPRSPAVQQIKGSCVAHPSLLHNF